MIQEAILEKIKTYLIDHQDFSHLDFSKLTLSIPKNTSHGDFSTNFALIVSSELKINPNTAKLFAISEINLILKTRLHIDASPINPNIARAINDDGTCTYIILTE